MMRDHRMLLSQFGLRCTRQRELVFDALQSASSHPTSEELFEIIQNRVGDAEEAGLSLATVYNTLEVFTNHGLARRIATPTGPMRYDPVIEDHVHVINTDGEVFDLPHEISRSLLDGISACVIKQIEKELGFRVSGISLHLHSINRDTNGKA